MAKVANGQANMQEIEEFKRVIELAKNLPPPGTPPANPKYRKHRVSLPIVMRLALTVVNPRYFKNQRLTKVTKSDS